MKKIIYLFVLTLAALVCSPAKAGDEVVDIVVICSTEEGEVIHRTPTQIPIECTYYSTLQTIVVNYLDDLGSVTVEIENQTTGEYCQTVVNALAGPMPFIISGTSGHWRITFTLPSGVSYYGEFDI